MSVLLHTDYYQDTLERRYCKNCQKSFIIGEELGSSVPQILCPYCGCCDNEAVAHMSDEDERREELGCIGIYFNKSDDKYFDYCIVCREAISAENCGGESLCKDCHSKARRKAVT